MAKQLSLMGQLRKEADRDFSRYLKYVNKIFEENKMLHEELGKLHSLWSKDTKHIQELEEEVKELKRCWSIEIETCNRYREKCEKLEEELKHREEGDYGYDYFDED